MSAVCLPPQPLRVLLHKDPQRNKHAIWTQDFSKTRGWLMPEERDISAPIAEKARLHVTPSAALTRWAFSHPNCNHFMFVTQLTISNYDYFDMRDVLTALDSVPRLQELQLCRVNIIPNVAGPLFRPPGAVRSLRRLAIEACNITEGLVEAQYDLLFRFVALFERIECLRLVATMYREDHLFYSPNLSGLRLPTILHLEAEGFSGYVLWDFFQRWDGVHELVSLHLSRCLASWTSIYWIEGIVRQVAPTIRRFAWRPNLNASTYGWGNDNRDVTHLNDFVNAFKQCTVLRELELGLYAPNLGPHFGLATSLFRRIIEALPEPKLDRVAFVLDIGQSSADAVPWAALDAALNRVCDARRDHPLQVRIDRYESPRERTDYVADRKFWSTRLPIMHRKMLVQDRVRPARHFVGHYDAPASIDPQRDARLAAPGLRSLFDV